MENKCEKNVSGFKHCVKATVGGMPQWLERWSLAGGLYLIIS